MNAFGFVLGVYSPRSKEDDMFSWFILIANNCNLDVFSVMRAGQDNLILSYVL